MDFNKVMVRIAGDEYLSASRILSLRCDEWNTFNVFAVVTPRRRDKVKHFHSQQQIRKKNRETSIPKTAELLRCLLD